MKASRERGRPARTKPGTALATSPTWINRQRRHGLSFGLADGVPAHRVAACSIALKLSGGQRDSMRAGRPRSQHAGGTPALPGKAGPAVPCGSFEGKRPIINEDEPRIDTNTDGPPSTTSGTKMLLQFCALGVTMPWDEGFLGARASRPHQAWHSLGHLPHLDQPATAPWLSFGLADGVPADRVAACSIALKLSAGQRDSMRAGRPRSQGNHSPLEGESQKPSRQAKADAVGGVWRVTSSESRRAPFGVGSRGRCGITGNNFAQLPSLA